MKKPLLKLSIILLCLMLNASLVFAQVEETVTSTLGKPTFSNTSGQQMPSLIVTGNLVRISPKVRDIPKVPIDPNFKPENEGNTQIFREKVNKNSREPIDNPNANSTDKNIQRSVNANGPTAVNALIQSFDGAGQADNTARGFGLVIPPDPVISVGPNHVVDMINLVHKVYDKSGNVLSGPTKFSEIAGTSTNQGDPIVLYDQVADRWFLMQFNGLFTNGAESLIFCVSTTNDPTGSYYVYEFYTPGVFPDYPHVAIWNNSILVTTHNFNLSGSAYIGQGFWAFDRTKMLNGDPTASGVGFQDSNAFGYLPASTEGFKTPESNSLPTFVTWDSDEFGGTDQLQYRTLNPNFANLGASVLSPVTNLPVAAFDGRDPNGRNDVEQAGSTNGLDALGGRMMSRITYRRFDNYESMVMNYTVNVSGVTPSTKATYTAAPRWYELTRANPTDPWVINQGSSFAPTSTDGSTGINRWMGCAGIDQRGNIALGYSRSSSTANPDLYFAERRKSDPLSTLGAEQIFQTSGGSQTDAANRWGDYSAMAIDPTDEETLWFTGEYFVANSARAFSTRIGSFKINDPITTISVHFQKGGTIARQRESTTAPSGPPNFPYKDYPITLVIDNAPSQNVDVTLSHTGTATEGVDYDILNASGLTLNAGNLTKQFTLRVYNNALNEVDEFIDFAYTLNANSGDGVAGAYNQKHRVTIVGKAACTLPFISYTCSSPTATLTATCMFGTPNWYDASGASLLSTGSVYTTPSLSGPTTYKARCEEPDCQSAFSPVTVFAERLYVNQAATGGNTGADWANAYTNLQSALNQACNSNLTEIWVAQGTYKPASCLTCGLTDASRAVSFNIPSGVKVYGGFAGNETTLSNRDLALVHTTNLTTLSGDLKGDDGANFTNTEDNSKSIVKFTGSNTNTLLDGFTIKGGNSFDLGGGATIAAGSSPQIANCTFEQNNASGFGLDQQSTTLSTSGVGITTTTFGGQTFTPSFSGLLTKADINLFCSNCTGTAPNLTLSVRATTGGLPTGADLATATIPGFNSGSGGFFTATFASPVSLTAGTEYALIIRPTVNPTVGTYALTRSATNVYAGGQRVVGTSSGTVWSGQTTDVGFHTFMVSSSANGGAIQNNGTLTLNNSVLTKNNSVANGGAIFNNGALTLINSTINANAASSGGAIFSNGAAGIATVSNAIFFDNTNSFANAGGGTSTASYSLFDNMTNVTDGGNNITTVASPFVSATDLHLACASPAINVGTTSNAPVKDIEGKARPYVGAASLVDMGAYEFQGDITFAASNNSPICETTTLNLTTNGGTGYAWAGPNSFSSTLQNPTIATVTTAATGTYTVTITYGTGCTATATTAVTINAKPAAPTITPPTNLSVCSPSTLTLTASGCAGTVVWSQGAVSGTSLTLTSVGTYSITATCTENGCVSDASTAVNLEIYTVPNAPTGVAISNTNVCSGTSIDLTATCATGVVNWYTSQTGGSAIGTGSPFTTTPTGNTTYYPTCKLGSCESSRNSGNSEINNTLTVGEPVFNRPVSTSGLSGVGTAVHYKSFPINFASTGNKTISLIDADGAVTTPTAFDSFLCLYGSGGFNPASPLTNIVALNDDFAGAANRKSRIVYNVTTPGNYTIVLTTFANTPVATGGDNPLPWTYKMVVLGDASVSVSVTVTPSPNAPTGVSANTASVCAGSSVVLSASCSAPLKPAYIGLSAAAIAEKELSANAPSVANVIWYTSLTGGVAIGTGSSFTYTPTSTNTYYAACAEGTCESSRVATSEVTFNLIPNAPSITPPTSLVVCSPSTLTLTASGCAGTVTWSQGAATGTSLTISAVGTYSISATCTVNGCTSGASSTVTGLEIKAKPNAPTITPPTSLSACSPSTLTLTASGCAGIVTWSQGAATGTSLTLSAVGSYSISATCTVNGCTSDPSAAVSLQINQKPVVSAGADQVICAGTPVSLVATCNLYSIATTLNGASQVPPNASTATGNVIGILNTITNQLDLNLSFSGLTGGNATAAHIHNGAAGTNGPVIIPFTGFPTTTSGAYTNSFASLSATNTAAIVAGNTYVNIHNSAFPGGELRGQVTATCIANTYVWNPGNLSGATVSISPITTATYTVTATNSTTGCSATATTVVNVNPKPNAPTITPPTSLSVCSPSTLTLTASGCAGIVTWSQGAATGTSLTISTIGTYSVSATCTVSGCTSDPSTAVSGLEIKAKPNAPSITPPTTLVVCSPSTLTLTASGCAGIITWSQGAATGTSLTLSAVGTYSISATCMVNGCTSDASTTVSGLEIKAKPNAPSITPPTSLSVCSPSTLTLTASGCAGIVTWSQGAATGTSLIISTVGTYSVSATCTVNGCTSDASSTISGLEIKAKPSAPTITPPTTLVVCSPSTLTLTASGCAGIVTWSQGAATGTSLTLSAVGTYSVSATCTVNGCTSDASSAVSGLEIKALPIISATNTGPYTVGQTINLNASGGGTYNWSGPNNFSSTLSNPAITNALSVNAGIYTLSVVGVNGCGAIATTNVIVSGIDPCDPSRIVDYFYVKAGNPHQSLFQLTDGMVINQRTDQVSILVTPSLCPSVTIESFEMNIQGPGLNWNIIQNIAPNALFDNLGSDIWGRNFTPGNYTLTVTGYAQDNKGGSITYGPKIISFTVVGNLASINTPTLSKTAICAGNSVDVSFTTSGAFNLANQFNIELSDSSGNFNAPALIGTTSTVGTVTCTIPANTIEGTKYLIRVVSSNQILVSNPAISQVTVHPLTYNLVSPTNNLTGTNNKKAVNIINASNKVISPANVIYQAGKAIVLSPGFESGAIFKAEIQGCN